MQNMQKLFSSRVRNAAHESVGPKPKSRLKHHSSDETLLSLVERRYELRQQPNNNQSLDRTGLQTSINHLTNDIQKRLTELRSETVDQVCHNITSTACTRSTHDSRQMFEAVWHLQKSEPSQNSIGVHDESG